jgi:polysaccharide export outer membrane protein
MRGRLRGGAPAGLRWRVIVLASTAVVAIAGCAAPRTDVGLPADLDGPPPLQRPEDLKVPPLRVDRQMTVEEQLQALRRAIDETRASPVLGKGDILSISVYDEPELSLNAVPVRPDGMISFPLIGDVQAAGRSVDELASSLTQRLSQFVLMPKVAVVVQQLNSLTFTISGEVEKPGVYPLVTDVRLSEAVAIAGGFKKGLFRSGSAELADLSSAFISRQGQILPVDFPRLFRQGDLRFDIQLQAGDYISIPSGLAREIYVVGEVNAPSQIAMREDMPLSATLALAEGYTREADLTRVHVVRGNLSNPELIVANLKDVLTGKAQDITLRAGDVVYVPPTALSTWSQMLNQIMPTITAIQTGIIFGNSVRGSN